MDKELIEEIYEDYKKKYDDIIKKYGKRDGFVVNDQLWWDYYREQIAVVLQKIEKNELTLNDASNFYKSFGFGPKLYGVTFIENGIEKIKNLFLFLADDSISPVKKIRELVEEPESENYFKGVGINFITLFLTTSYPSKYVQWNAQTDEALKLLKSYPQKAKGEKKSEFLSK